MRKSEAKAGLTGTMILGLLLLPISVLSESMVFTADTGNNRIQVFNTEGVFMTQWGNYGTGNGELNLPTGIAAGRLIYVTDSGNNRIQQFSRDGAWLAAWGGTAAAGVDGMFSSPYGITISYEGCNEFVYVADTGNNRIQKFSTSGGWLASWSGFNSPQGIAAEPSGMYIYVADTGNNKIQKLDTNGNVILVFGGYGTIDGKMKFPRDIAVDSRGRVYVADYQNYRIQRFSSDGVFELKWGTKGSEDGQFFDHYSVAADDKDNIYAADAGNNRVQVFTCDGEWIRTLGTSVQGDGEAEFYYPMGVDVYFERPVKPECMPTDTATETYTETYTETPTDTATETYTETYTETPTDTATETYTETYTETPTDTATETYTEIYTETPTDTATETYTETPADTATEIPVITPVDPSGPPPEETPTAVTISCSLCYSIEFGSRVKKTCDMPATEGEKGKKKHAARGERLDVYDAAGGGFVYVLKSGGLTISVYDAGGCYIDSIREMECRKNGRNSRHFTPWFVKHKFNKHASYLVPPEYYIAMMFPQEGLAKLDTKDIPAPAEMDGTNTYIYPNPCGGRSVIRFALPASRAVDIVISNVTGRPVWQKHLRPDETIPGVNYVIWEGVDDRGIGAPNGTYILRVISEGKIVIKKIAVLR